MESAYLFLPQLFALCATVTHLANLEQGKVHIIFKNIANKIALASRFLSSLTEEADGRVRHYPTGV